ncbi:MAG TPA: polysaccharide deacetylase family protein [Candidatus Sulfotelmatobacter sp.]|nr:polysaccharide deacetylase family protein [Candidatus Sulfotelmatobacter sp.]
MKLRLDRSLTLYLFSPGRQIFGSGSKSVPILMYHSVCDQDESGVHAYYRTSTTPQVFSEQMQFLKAEGYLSCSLDAALGYLKNDAAIERKLVVITFDDGYSDFYQHAFPVLQRYELTASMFLPTAYIGDSPLHFKDKDCLTWQRVRELSRYGISFGSHTVTHPRLVEMNVDQIDNELATSKNTIEDQLGIPAESFAYPYAFPQTNTEFKRTLKDSLLRAGYRNGVCTVVGRADSQSEPLFLERLPANSDDDPALFAAKLAGAYDWISAAQQISKTVKGRLRGLANRPKLNFNKELPTVQGPS